MSRYFKQLIYLDRITLHRFPFFSPNHLYSFIMKGPFAPSGEHKKRRPWPASLLEMGMTLVLLVGCTDVNQCGPLYAPMRTLTWTLGIVSP